MNKKLKIAIPIVAGVLTITTGAGVAAAKIASQNTIESPIGSYQVAGNPENTPDTWYCGGPGSMTGFGIGFPVTPQVASLLGTTITDLKSQLESGKTLAEIAATKGISQEQLVQTMTEPYKDHVDLMVKYAYIAPEGAESLLQQAQERVKTIITSPFQIDSEEQWEHMSGMMYGWGTQQGEPGTGVVPGMHGGMMNGWDHSQPQPGTGTAPRNGFGSMMGGYGGGMMGGR